MMPRHLCATRALAVLCIAGTTAAAAQETIASEYLTVRLPHGVRVKLPRNWRILTDHSRITLNAASEALQNEINAERLPSTLPFAANYYDGRKVTAGIVNVRYYPELYATQAVARSLQKGALAEFDAELPIVHSHGLVSGGRADSAAHYRLYDLFSHRFPNRQVTWNRLHDASPPSDEELKLTAICACS